jgi:hypothetical protein
MCARRPAGAQYQLDEHEAFRAMAAFLSQFAQRAGNDLLTLMSDITLDPEGRTFDPAAWDDWLACVRSIKGDAHT